MTNLLRDISLRHQCQCGERFLRVMRTSEAEPIPSRRESYGSLAILSLYIYIYISELLIYISKLVYDPLTIHDGLFTPALRREHFLPSARADFITCVRAFSFILRNGGSITQRDKLYTPERDSMTLNSRAHSRRLCATTRRVSSIFVNRC